MKTTSEPKTIESTPISTIKEKLRAKLNSVEKAEAATNEHLKSPHSDAMSYSIVRGRELGEKGEFAEMAHQHLPALLESHDLLEAERRWVSVSESLPDADEEWTYTLWDEVDEIEVDVKRSKLLLVLGESTDSNEPMHFARYVVADDYDPWWPEVGEGSLEVTHWMYAPALPEVTT